MKIKNNIYLLILNIIHTLMCIGIWAVTITYAMNNNDLLFVGFVIILITILAITGMWLLYSLPSSKAAVILLRIKSIFKLIFIVCLSFVIMILLLAAIDCSHSLSGNEGGAPLSSKLPVIIPFISIFVLSVFYLVIYQILLSYINKKKVNRPIMIMAFIFNVLLCLFGILLTVSSLMQVLGNAPLINFDLISELHGVIRYVFIGVLVLYIGYKGLTSFLLMKTIVKK